MRKEVVFAILIGLSLGLIVVFGVKTAKDSLAERSTRSKTQTLLGTTPSQKSNTNHNLLITTPNPDEIVTDAELAIIGSTTPGSMIGVVSESNESIVIADETGAFNATIQLTGGLNTLTLTSHSPTGEDTTTSFSIIYTTADLSATESATKKK